MCAVICGAEKVLPRDHARPAACQRFAEGGFRCKFCMGLKKKFIARLTVICFTIGLQKFAAPKGTPANCFKNYYCLQFNIAKFSGINRRNFLKSASQVGNLSDDRMGIMIESKQEGGHKVRTLRGELF